MTEKRTIHVLNKAVELAQPENGFKTSLDSVLLAAACLVKKSESVLDLGCGVGSVLFCLLHRVPDIKVCGIDVQEDYLEIAAQNHQLNAADKDVSFIFHDVREYEIKEQPDRFDHITCNPPFLDDGTHIKAGNEGLARARSNDTGVTIADWVDAAYRLLKQDGSFTMIHRADMTDRIIQALGERFGSIEIIPLWPKAGKDAKRVIIRARRNSKAPSTIRAGLILHDDDGQYTKQADNILRDASPLL